MIGDNKNSYLQRKKETLRNLPLCESIKMSCFHHVLGSAGITNRASQIWDTHTFLNITQTATTIAT